MHKEVGGHKSLEEFKLELVKSIITSSTLPNYSSRGRPHSGPTPLRLQGRHFPEKIQPPSNTNNECYKKRCIVCHQRQIRKETTYQCDACEISLCIIPCFKEYHTKTHY